MFEGDGDRDRGTGSDELAACVDWLAGLSIDVPDAERVDVIGECEAIKAAAAAAQARFTAAFDTSQRAEQAAAGVAPKRVGQGVAAQVGLARRESPA